MNISQCSPVGISKNNSWNHLAQIYTKHDALLPYCRQISNNGTTIWNTITVCDARLVVPFFIRPVDILKYCRQYCVPSAKYVYIYIYMHQQYDIHMNSPAIYTDEFASKSCRDMPAIMGPYWSGSPVLGLPLTHWGRDKWTPFRRRHFQMYFHEWKCSNSD